MTMVKSTEEIKHITGTNYLVYVLWGESPEDPEYITYGFDTVQEMNAFLAGIDEGDGWMGYTTGWGVDTDKKALKSFEDDIRNEHPDLFRSK